MTHQDRMNSMIAHFNEVQSALGPTAVALYLEGGQGVCPTVFRVIVLPESQYKKEIVSGSISEALRKYAGRKAKEIGYGHRRASAMPVAWIAAGHLGLYAW